jgi:hypothetical protein
MLAAAVAGTTLVGAALLAAPLVVPRLLPADQPVVCGSDALQATAIAGLSHFASWLKHNHASGFIGEVGWPANDDSAAWNALADTWYTAADRIGLPVTAWAAGRWPATYDMAVYRSAAGSPDLTVNGPQADVVERHGTSAGYARGVVVATGSFGASDTSATFSSANPGRFGQEYTYETAAGYTYLASRGTRLVRLTFSWERLQPVPFGPLDGEELGRLRVAIDQAGQSGLSVLLDLHSYGVFSAGTAPTGPIRRLPLGSADLPTTALAAFWTQLASATADEPAVVAYGLMNEPTRLAAKGHDGALIWERAAQESVAAIRATGSSRVIAVSGYAQMSPAQWGRMHPRAWIDDPLNRVVYEAHAYFDADNSGRYDASYTDELRRVEVKPPKLCQVVARLGRTPLAP